MNNKLKSNGKVCKKNIFLAILACVLILCVSLFAGLLQNTDTGYAVSYESYNSTHWRTDVNVSFKGSSVTIVGGEGSPLELSDLYGIDGIILPENGMVTGYQFAAKPIDVATSDGTTYVILADGSVWTAGTEMANIIGGEYNFKFVQRQRKKAGRMEYFNDAKKIDVNEGGLVICDDGSVWTTSDNNYGQRGLGHNRPVDTSYFEELKKDGVSFNAIDAAIGSTHIAILDKDNNLYVSGKGSTGNDNNIYESLGTGNDAGSYTFRVSSGFDGKPIAIDLFDANLEDGMGVVCENGTVWGIGYSDNFVFATGSDTLYANSFVQAQKYDPAYASNGNTSGYVPINNAVDIDMCNSSAIILCNDGSVLSAGQDFDHLGWSRPDDAHQCFDYVYNDAVKTNGDKFNNTMKVSASGYATIVLCLDGTIWVAGSDEYSHYGEMTTEVGFRQLQFNGENIDNAIRMTAGFNSGDGSNSTIIMLADGSMISCGNNASGELGTGNNESVKGLQELTDTSVWAEQYVKYTDLTRVIVPCYDIEIEPIITPLSDFTVEVTNASFSNNDGLRMSYNFVVTNTSEMDLNNKSVKVFDYQNALLATGTFQDNVATIQISNELHSGTDLSHNKYTIVCESQYLLNAYKISTEFKHREVAARTGGVVVGLPTYVKDDLRKTDCYYYLLEEVKRIEVQNKPYDNQPYDLATLEFNSDRAVTKTYSTAVNGEYTDIAPTNAGKYFVKFSAAREAYYSSYESIHPFEITPAIITFTSGEAGLATKRYDGTTDVLEHHSNNPLEEGNYFSVKGLVAGDSATVIIDYAEWLYPDVTAENNGIRYTFRLSDTVNYQFPTDWEGNPQNYYEASGSIGRAEIDLGLINDVVLEKEYDGTTDFIGELVEGTHYTATGLAVGDELKVVSATYNSATVGGASTVTVRFDVPNSENYVFAVNKNPLIITAKIKAKTVTITKNEVTFEKEYDETTELKTTLVEGTHYTVSGLVGSDKVTLASANYNSANVLDATTVTAQFTLPSDNYVFADGSASLEYKGTITVRAVTLPDFKIEVEEAKFYQQLDYLAMGYYFVVTNTSNVNLDEQTVTVTNAENGIELTGTFKDGKAKIYIVEDYHSTIGQIYNQAEAEARNNYTFTCSFNDGNNEYSNTTKYSHKMIAANEDETKRYVALPLPKNLEEVNYGYYYLEEDYTLTTRWGATYLNAVLDLNGNNLTVTDGFIETENDGFNIVDYTGNDITLNSTSANSLISVACPVNFYVKGDLTIKRDASVATDNPLINASDTSSFNIYALKEGATITIDGGQGAGISLSNTANVNLPAEGSANNITVLINNTQSAGGLVLSGGAKLNSYNLSANSRINVKVGSVGRFTNEDFFTKNSNITADNYSTIFTSSDNSKTIGVSLNGSHLVAREPNRITAPESFDKEYTGTNYVAPEITMASGGITTLTFATEQSGGYIATAPTNVGTYWMKISAEMTDEYLAFEEIREFNITPQPRSTFEDCFTITVENGYFSNQDTTLLMNYTFVVENNSSINLDGKTVSVKFYTGNTEEQYSIGTGIFDQGVARINISSEYHSINEYDDYNANKEAILARNNYTFSCEVVDGNYFDSYTAKFQHQMLAMDGDRNKLYVALPFSEQNASNFLGYFYLDKEYTLTQSITVNSAFKTAINFNQHNLIANKLILVESQYGINFVDYSGADVGIYRNDGRGQMLMGSNFNFYVNGDLTIKRDKDLSTSGAPMISLASNYGTGDWAHYFNIYAYKPNSTITIYGGTGPAISTYIHDPSSQFDLNLPAKGSAENIKVTCMDGESYYPDSFIFSDGVLLNSYNMSAESKIFFSVSAAGQFTTDDFMTQNPQLTKDNVADVFNFVGLNMVAGFSQSGNSLSTYNIEVVKSYSVENMEYNEQAYKDDLATITLQSGREVTKTYSTEKDGKYTAEIPVNAGTYFVKFIAAEWTETYLPYESEPYKFQITPQPREISNSFTIKVIDGIIYDEAGWIFMNYKFEVTNESDKNLDGQTVSVQVCTDPGGYSSPATYKTFSAVFNQGKATIVIEWEFYAYFDVIYDHEAAKERNKYKFICSFENGNYFDTYTADFSHKTIGEDPNKQFVALPLSKQASSSLMGYYYLDGDTELTGDINVTIHYQSIPVIDLNGYNLTLNGAFYSDGVSYSLNIIDYTGNNVALRSTSAKPLFNVSAGSFVNFEFDVSGNFTIERDASVVTDKPLINVDGANASFNIYALKEGSTITIDGGQGAGIVSTANSKIRLPADGSANNIKVIIKDTLNAGGLVLSGGAKLTSYNLSADSKINIMCEGLGAITDSDFFATNGNITPENYKNAFILSNTNAELGISNDESYLVVRGYDEILNHSVPPDKEYDGNPNEISYTLKSGREAKLLFATEEGGKYAEGSPTNAGTYYVKFVVEEMSDSYFAFESDPYKFVITRQQRDFENSFTIKVIDGEFYDLFGGLYMNYKFEITHNSAANLDEQTVTVINEKNGVNATGKFENGKATIIIEGETHWEDYTDTPEEYNNYTFKCLFENGNYFDTYTAKFEHQMFAKDGDESKKYVALPLTDKVGGDIFGFWYLEDNVELTQSLRIYGNTYNTVINLNGHNLKSSSTITLNSQLNICNYSETPVELWATNINSLFVYERGVNLDFYVKSDLTIKRDAGVATDNPLINASSSSSFNVYALKEGATITIDGGKGAGISLSNSAQLNLPAQGSANNIKVLINNTQSAGGLILGDGTTFNSYNLSATSSITLNTVGTFINSEFLNNNTNFKTLYDVVASNIFKMDAADLTIGVSLDTSHLVARGQDSVTAPESFNKEYTGTNYVAPEITMTSGRSPAITYSTTESGGFGSTAPTNAGKYYIRLWLPETDEYSVFEQIIPFEITRKIVTLPDFKITVENLTIGDVADSSVFNYTFVVTNNSEYDLDGKTVTVYQEQVTYTRGGTFEQGIARIKIVSDFVAGYQEYNDYKFTLSFEDENHSYSVETKYAHMMMQMDESGELQVASLLPKNGSTYFNGYYYLEEDTVLTGDYNANMRIETIINLNGFNLTVDGTFNVTEIYGLKFVDFTGKDITLRSVSSQSLFNVSVYSFVNFNVSGNLTIERDASIETNNPLINVNAPNASFSIKTSKENSTITIDGGKGAGISLSNNATLNLPTEGSANNITVLINNTQSAGGLILDDSAKFNSYNLATNSSITLNTLGTFINAEFLARNTNFTDLDAVVASEIFKMDDADKVIGISNDKLHLVARGQDRVVSFNAENKVYKGTSYTSADFEYTLASGRTAELYFSYEFDGTFNMSELTNAGTYYVKFYVYESTDSYLYLTSDSYEFKIIPAPVTVSAKEYTDPLTKTYDGTTDFNKTNIKFNQHYTIDSGLSGAAEAIGVKSATFNSPNVTDANEIVVVFESTNANFAVSNDSITLKTNVSITASTVTISAGTEALTMPYNGTTTYIGDDPVKGTHYTVSGLFGEDTLTFVSAIFDSKNVNDATSAKAKFTLNNPNYILEVGEVDLTANITPKELAFVWEGSDNGFSYIYQAGTPQGPTATIDTGIDGETIAEGAFSISGNQKTDVGNYKATITINNAENFPNYTFTNLAQQFHIVEGMIEIPKVVIGDYTYTGSLQTVEVAKSDDYVVTGNTQTDAGRYTITITLNSQNATSWSDGSTAPITFDWEIKKATYAFLDNLVWSSNPTYDGTTKWMDLTGEIPDGIYIQHAVGNSAVEAGEYNAWADWWDGWDSNNYNNPKEHHNTRHTWRILKQEVDPPTISGTYGYTGLPQTVKLADESLYRVTANGTQTAVGTHQITVTLKDPSNYKWKGNDEVNGSADILVGWTIDKGTFDLGGIVWSDNPTYDGGTKSIYITGGLPNDLTVKTYSGNSGIKAGDADGQIKYTATVMEWEYNAANYYAPKSISHEWYIEKGTYVMDGVTWSPNPTYDGQTKSIHITGGLPAGVDAVTYSGNSGIKAGDESGQITYTATVTEWTYDKANYNMPSVSYDWHIEKGTYDLSGIVWSPNPTYDKDNDQSVEIVSGLPSGFAIVEYSGNTARNAGNHTASAKFTGYDSYNYKDPYETYEYVWQILKKEVTTPTISREYVFNNSNQAVVVAGDGLNVYYAVVTTNDANVKKDAGRYDIEVQLLDPANCKWEGLGDDVATIVLEWIIEKATFKMDSIVWSNGTTYNGSEQEVMIVSGLPEGLTVKTYSENKKTNAGTYYANVTEWNFNKNNYYDPIIADHTWQILKQEVALPEIVGTYEYNGDNQTVVITENGPYAVTANGTQKDAGEHNVIVSLNDFANYKWANSEDKSITLVWTIDKGTFVFGTIEWTKNPTYSGNEQEVTIISGLPDGLTVKTYSENKKTNAGTYKANVTEWNFNKNNYYDPTIEDHTWQILKQEVALPEIVGTYEYNGEKQTVVITESGLYGVTENGTQTNADTYNVIVTLNDFANYKWQGLEDDVATITLKWKIDKGTFVFGTIEWSKNPTYNGSDHTVEIVSGLPNGLTVNTYSGNTKKDAGNYKAEVLEWNFDKANYNAPEVEILHDWIIEKATFKMDGIVWSGNPTYDGGNHTVEIVSGLPSGLTVKTYSGNTEKDAGSYTANVTEWDFNKQNYNVPTIEEHKWQILKQEVDKPSISGTYEYNGSEQQVVITESGLYKVTANGKQTNAGNHNVTVALTDSANYKWKGVDEDTATITLVWSIERATFVFDEIKWSQNPTYDGGNQTITIVSGLPNDLTVKTYTGNTATNAGSYKATVSEWNFDETNYYKPEVDVSYNWSINKATVEMPQIPAVTQFTYDASAKGLAIEESVNYTIKGNSETTVGKYQTTISLNDTKNYQWTNNTIDNIVIKWSINKATVEMPQIPAVTQFIYDASAKGLAIEESVNYTINGNSETTVGNYQTIISLNDTKNYQWSNNTIDNIVIKWSIEKATYEFGEIVWSQNPTYNGGEQSITIVSGLPEGVTVKTYLGNTETNAGTYTANVAVWNFDETNYNTPSIKNYTWSVLKCEVELPSIVGTYEYNGSEQKVEITSNGLYSVTANGTQTNADTYKITVSLKDFNNYKWKGSDGATITLDWTIEKATFDTSNVVWSGNLTYIGSEQSVTIVSGLPNGLTVKTYSGNTATNAGTYSATVAEWNFDKANYNMPTIEAHSWTIAKASVQIPALSANSFMHDGQTKTVTVATSELYAVSGDLSGVEARVYTVTLTLRDSDNYAWVGNSAASVSLTWSINVEIVESDNGSVTIESNTPNGINPEYKLKAEAIDVDEIKIEGKEVAHGFDITLENNGVAVQPDGSIKIRVLIDEEYRSRENLAVYYIADDGSAIDMNAVRDGDYVEFETDHLSKYVIVADPVEAGAPIGLIVGLAVAGVVIIAAITVFCVIQNKKRRR